MSRFFSAIRWSKRLPKNFKHFAPQPNASMVEELVNLKQEKMHELGNSFPEIMQVNFPQGEIAYRLCSLSPEQMVAQGGFKARETELYFASRGSEYNRGSVCFTLLPSVATIFAENFSKKSKLYLYACLLRGNYIAPGGKWRQVIAPVLYPFPKYG